MSSRPGPGVAWGGRRGGLVLNRTFLTGVSPAIRPLSENGDPNVPGQVREAGPG